MLDPDRANILSGIELVAFDVDGTLADYHGAPDENVKAMLSQLGERGLNLCIISNAYGPRVEELDELFGRPFDMPVFTPGKLVAAGEKETKYRKPSPAMLERAAYGHGIALGRTLMVGDQIAKDVVSANRAGKAGAKSLLVPRRGSGDHPGVRIFQRPAEAAAREMLGIRFE